MIPSRFGADDGTNPILASEYGVSVGAKSPNVFHMRRLLLKSRLVGSKAFPPYYVHKRYALPCQIWLGGIEL